jgi:glycerate-2-kinase
MNKQNILDSIKAALVLESPARKVSEALGYDAASDVLAVRGRAFSLKGRKVYICGFGKCAFEMAAGAHNSLGARIDSGLLLSYGEASIGGAITISRSSHPLPDENTLINSRRLVEFAANAREEDLLICLVSGGGSSFFELPAEGVDFNDLIALNSSMVKSAMPIADINIVRKALSAVKGGKFLRHIRSSLITLAVSDTAGSDPADIASGPTWPCVIDKAAALEILEKYNIPVPRGVMSYLQGPSGPGCVKCNTNLNSKNMIFEIVADNASFLKALGGIFNKKYGVKVFISNRFLTGSESADTATAGEEEEGGGTKDSGIKTAAGFYLRSIENIRKEYSKEFIFIAGGEVPVGVKNKNGRGGRCQHFALEIMKALKELPVRSSPAGAGFDKFVFAAFATDGLEAFTNAAGAVFDEKDMAAANLDEINSSLNENNSFDFFGKSGGLITTGATGLNANDAFIAYCGVKKIGHCRDRFKT